MTIAIQIVLLLITFVSVIFAFDGNTNEAKFNGLIVFLTSIVAIVVLQLLV